MPTPEVWNGWNSLPATVRKPLEIRRISYFSGDFTLSQDPDTHRGASRLKTEVSLGQPSVANEIPGCFLVFTAEMGENRNTMFRSLSRLRHRHSSSLSARPTTWSRWPHQISVPGLFASPPLLIPHPNPIPNSKNN